jgi:AraC-like DNA-binding protein
MTPADKKIDILLHFMISRQRRKPMREPTISIHFVNAVVRHCRHRPGDCHRLLTRNRIAPRLLHEPGARVPARDYANLIRDTMVLLRDETLGYGRQPQPLGTWEMICRSAIGSENLGEAIRRLSRFCRLIDWSIAPRTLRSGDRVTVSLEPRDAGDDFGPYIYESFLFYLHRFANWLIAEEVPLLEVTFAFPEPVYASEYGAMFLDSPVTFEQPVSSITFGEHYLEKRIRRDQESLNGFLKHPNHTMIVQQYDQKSWQYRVRALLASQLAEHPTYADIARQLHIHPQTLRRRLRNEGVVYRELKDRLRRDTAIHLLSNRNMTVEETALATGFSEASSFIRSFSKWTGVTPYTYQKPLRTTDRR